MLFNEAGLKNNWYYFFGLFVYKRFLLELNLYFLEFILSASQIFTSSED